MQVCVIGAGQMGNGIAQISATAGHEVRMVDVSADALERGRASIEASLARVVKKGTLTAEQVTEIWGRLTLHTSIAAGAADADVVIEAVPEILDLKHSIFAQVAESSSPGTLLGTNTSQTSITALAAPLGDRAANFVGIHFFNPPVMMRLVELIRGLQTSDETLARARSFAEGLGKEVVVCQKDSPGFLTSRISAILRLECVRMLEEGLGTAEDIDTAIRLGFNHPMGPLELGDFNGLDTFYHVLTALEKAHGDRFKPTPTVHNMIAAGWLGRKTGRGFYSYQPVEPARPAPPAQPAQPDRPTQPAGDQR
jgi:3-hydroxybutyryl-CoA dehydrogenase